MSEPMMMGEGNRGRNLSGPPLLLRLFILHTQHRILSFYPSLFPRTLFELLHLLLFGKELHLPVRILFSTRNHC